MTPDPSIAKCTDEELDTQLNQEIYHGATEEVWRAVYQDDVLAVVEEAEV